MKVQPTVEQPLTERTLLQLYLYVRRVVYMYMGVLLHADVNINYFDKYGRRSGFNILTLRYMLQLNCNRNLQLSLDELLALAACVFCRVDEPWYTGLALMPSVRCITVASCFQVTDDSAASR